MSRFKYGELVRVVWADHFCTGPHDSYTKEEIDEMSKPLIRKTVGHFMNQKKQTITIAGTEEEDGTYTDVNVFMKRAVIRVEAL